MSDRELLKRKYKEFLDEYGANYPSHALEFIKENFWSLRNSTEAPDILMQIYSELGVRSEDNNMYIAHLKRIKENFDISGNVLDIGCGAYPAFGTILAREQLKLGNGTITLYDPHLVMDKPKYKNMKLHKEEFTEEVEVKDFDLIMGILPCDATELIVEKACENNKDFYLAMCGCTHFDNYTLFRLGGMVTPKMYQDYVINKTKKLLKKYNNGNLVIDKLENHYGMDYPILYNKKTK